MPEIPPAAELKLQRSKHHIADLNGKLQAYIDQRPFKAVRRFNPETGYMSLAIKPDIPIPDELSCILGDAIHNLRSALDHAYFAIISRYTEREDNIQFPIWKLGDNSKESVLGRRLIKLAPKDVRTAVEQCEPHPGGRYNIHELDIMDVRDKHRLPILAGRAAGIPAALVNVLLPEAGVRMGGPGVLNFAGQGEEAFKTQIPIGHPSFKFEPYETDTQFRPPITLFFADGPFKDKPLVPLLVELEGFVREAIENVWAAAN